MSRRKLVQSLAAFAIPASIPATLFAQDPAPPLIRATTVNHVSISVRDLEASRKFYEQLLGTTKGWRAANPAKTIHLALPDGYISLTTANDQKGIIDHYSVGVDSMDEASAKTLAANINRVMPDAKATAGFDGTVYSVSAHDPDGVRVQISPKNSPLTFQCLSIRAFLLRNRNHRVVGVPSQLISCSSGRKAEGQGSDVQRSRPDGSSAPGLRASSKKRSRGFNSTALIPVVVCERSASIYSVPLVSMW